MNWFKHISNGFLAIMLLVATTGITLNKHYCMGRLKSIAINVQANNCNPDGEEKMPCCDDVSELLKIEEATNLAFDFDGAPDLIELAIITFGFEFEPVHRDVNLVLYANHDPPLPDKPKRILYQSFLI